jgi:hypothetical protein
MRLIDRLSRSQRVVVVVAIGLGLWVVGRYLVNLDFLDWTVGVHHGWVGQPLVTARLHLLPRLIIWLVVIGLWALAAVKVLRQPADSHTASEPNHEPAE